MGSIQEEEKKCQKSLDTDNLYGYVARTDLPKKVDFVEVGGFCPPRTIMTS